ncbi:MAG: Modification methylase HaeIII [Firmicutes bacterium ADurb.Bin080]|nr:MAG: Modification methylase HaeIII [Firmicutes bacterium ADurb.Bin080]
MHSYKVLSLFSGAGGLDLGFEQVGFSHLELVEIDDHCVATINANRPQWNIFHGDISLYKPIHRNIDILIGGPPCQGFSLGGNRNESDPRNRLFLEMTRIAKITNPRVIVIENVLNLRTMKAPWSGKYFADEIYDNFKKIGYSVKFDTFKVSFYGVPQTRRRFVFIAVKGDFPKGYELPTPDLKETTIRKYLEDISTLNTNNIPNHNPEWGFQSRVHRNRRSLKVENIKNPVPIRISRTGSDGNPIRSFDEPFPAIDTATVWGWAAGNVKAQREKKDRTNGKYIRNPDTDLKLWRIDADEMRTFTHREYARLQTFPDDWVFYGNNKRDIQKQVGNAVPVEFARRVGVNVYKLFRSLETNSEFMSDRIQVSLEL